MNVYQGEQERARRTKKLLQNLCKVPAETNVEAAARWHADERCKDLVFIFTVYIFCISLYLILNMWCVYTKTI